MKMSHKLTANYVSAAFVLLIVIISMEGVQCQNTELIYVIQEERPAMTHVGNVLEDSNIRELVSNDDIADLRFSFLTQGNPQASYLWINSTSGELKTSSRYVFLVVRPSWSSGVTLLSFFALCFTSVLI